MMILAWLIPMWFICVASINMMRPNGPDDPIFTACASKRNCFQNQESKSKLKLLANVKDTVSKVMKAGEIPTVIHIGAGGLINTQNFTDVHLYQKLLSIIPEAKDQIRMVFVEPDLKYNRITLANLKHIPIKAEHAQIVNSVMVGECMSDTQAFYSFDTFEVQKQFGMDNTASFSSWGSIDPIRPLHACYEISKGLENDPKSFSFFINEHDRNPYIAFGKACARNVSGLLKKDQVQCHTPSTLLAKAGVSGSSIIMVVVDAANADTGIVSAFLDYPGFAPGYLQWESPTWILDNQVHLHQVEWPNLVEKLHARGYVWGRDGEANNKVAIHEA